MKVAIPAYHGRVSPVFDTCRELVVFEDGEQAGTMSWPVDLSGATELSRAERMRDLGVNVLLCGGITQEQASRIRSLGIRLVAWLAGDVNDVVAAFREGRLRESRFAMPGCRGRCRRNRQGAAPWGLGRPCRRRPQ
jgi:predicted Fe-Mo cluster-binding NifX family protein